MRYLSPHFTLEELTRSQVAARAGDDLSNPPPDVLMNLTALCLEVLEPARAVWGRAVHISSGWRPRWVNAMIGGAENSAHIFGNAADCEVEGLSPLDAARQLAASAVKFDKCILEFGRWVHLGRAPGNQARELLTAFTTGGKTRYVDGIIVAGGSNV